MASLQSMSINWYYENTDLNMFEVLSESVEWNLNHLIVLQVMRITQIYPNLDSTMQLIQLHRPAYGLNIEHNLFLNPFTWFYLFNYLAFKCKRPSFEHDVSWKNIDLPGVGFFLDSITSSKKLMNAIFSPTAAFKWKHCFARATSGKKNVQISMVNADPIIRVSKNRRPVGLAKKWTRRFIVER